MDAITCAQQEIYVFTPRKVTRRRIKPEWEDYKKYKHRLKINKTQNVAHMTAGGASKKTFKNPSNESCQGCLSFLETAKMSLFERKKDKFPDSVELNLLLMHQVVWVFDTAADQSIFSANILDLSWLHIVCQRSMPKIRKVSNRKSTVP